MIEQALRRFCEFKHRKLTVIAGTIIVGLLLVMPLVDSIRAGRDEREALLTELESAQSVASELQSFESRVNASAASASAAMAAGDRNPAMRWRPTSLAYMTARVNEQMS